MSNYTGRFVWVGMTEYPFEGASLIGVWTSLTKAKKALGDGKDWRKEGNGRYERMDHEFADTVLIKVKTDDW